MAAQPYRTPSGLWRARTVDAAGDVGVLVGAAGLRAYPRQGKNVSSGIADARQPAGHVAAHADLPVCGRVLGALRPNRVGLGPPGKKYGFILDGGGMAPFANSVRQSVFDYAPHPGVCLRRLSRHGQGVSLDALAEDQYRVFYDGHRLCDFRGDRDADCLGIAAEYLVANCGVRGDHRGGGHGLDHVFGIFLHPGAQGLEIICHGALSPVGVPGERLYLVGELFHSERRRQCVAGRPGLLLVFHVGHARRLDSLYRGGQTLQRPNLSSGRGRMIVWLRLRLTRPTHSTARRYNKKSQVGRVSGA